MHTRESVRERMWEREGQTDRQRQTKTEWKHVVWLCTCTHACACTCLKSNKCFYSVITLSQTTTILVHCRNYRVCHKTQHTMKHCTNNTCSHSPKLQSTRTNSCLPFAPKHFSILSQPHRPHIPISNRWVSCLSACCLCVVFNDWNSWITNRVTDALYWIKIN